MWAERSVAVDLSPQEGQQRTQPATCPEAGLGEAGVLAGIVALRCRQGQPGILPETLQ